MILLRFAACSLTTIAAMPLFAAPVLYQQGPGSAAPDALRDGDRPSVDQEAASVLAQNQAATLRPHTGTLTVHYVYKTSGLVGEQIAVSDLATGAFIDTASAGPVTIGSGYDGRTPWMRDLSGAFTPQEGGDRIAVAVNDAYRRANLWWRKDRGGAIITYLGREGSEGHDLDHLSITPKGGKPFDAWFDARTHLLSRIAEMRQFFHTQAFYDDYRVSNGAMLPFQTTLDPGVGKDHYETLTVDRVAVGPAKARSAYARPLAAPTGMDLINGRTSVTNTFRLLNNHIYVTGEVEGKGPYTFIVDTGGHTLLSPRVIAEAGLNSRGKAASTGVGENVSTSGFAQVGEMVVAGIRMRNQTAIVTDVGNPAIEGIPIDGMIGFEVFRRFAVRIDYDLKTITFTNFKDFKPTDAGAPLPFLFYDHLPDVTGTVDGLPARFDIDTGSRTEVDLTSPFVARQGLRRRYNKGVSTITGWGVGGPSHDYVTRIPSITLGPIRVDGVVAGLSEDKGGSISDSNYEGNIGGGILKRFVVTFDYSRQIMFLKPIVPVPAGVGTFDRSGMWIFAEAAGYRVKAVVADGPAAQSGLLEGDLIRRIDGAPVEMSGLSETRAMLRENPSGTRVKLEILRGNKAQVIELTLRDQI